MAVAASPRARSGAASRMHLRSRAKRLPHAHVCDGIEAAVSFQFQKIGQRSPAGVVHVHDDAAQRAPVPADRASVHLGYRWPAGATFRTSRVASGCVQFPLETLQFAGILVAP
jgi:hypothetical protein